MHTENHYLHHFIIFVVSFMWTFERPTTTNATHAVVSQSVSGGVGGGIGNNLIENIIAKEATTMTIDKKQHITQNQNIDGNILKSNASSRTVREPCTIMCRRARGFVPTLQCVKCLCLYHDLCVGLNPYSPAYRRAVGASGRDYVCESCNPHTKSELSAKTNNATANVLSTSTTTAISGNATLMGNCKSSTSSLASSSTNTSRDSSSQKSGKALTKSSTSSTNIRSNATTATTSSTIAAAANKRQAPLGNNKLQQSLAVVKGKKYVVLEKKRIKFKNNELANDIENDLKQINESIRNSLPIQPALAKLEAAQQQQNANALTIAMQQHFARNVFSNMSYTFDSLLIILKYLKIHERMRFASVCKMWHAAANSRFVWETVRMKNSKVCNWAGCAEALQRNGTKHLDLRKMLFSSSRADEMWNDFSQHISRACFLEIIDLCRCPVRVVENLFNSNHNLRVLNAITINDDTLNLENIKNLSGLEELRLRTHEPSVLTGDLRPLSALTKLTHLSLTALRSLDDKHLEALAELTSLRCLELGECGSLDEIFGEKVLPKLTQLQRLRLENGQNTSCDTLSILEAVAPLEQLLQLELVNFDVRPGFAERLKQCKALSKLLIIATYLSQSATTNQTVLDAVQGIAPQLKVFTWGVTVELLRVTALYVGQCDESSKKEKHIFDESIPVLKPVPGAAAVDGHENELDNSGSTNTLSNAGEADGNAGADVPQIEILPLDKVERILAANMPNTKFHIIKIPYHATCKQQLVE